MSDPGLEGAVRLPSGLLSRVYALTGPDADVVVKLAPAATTAREAAALRAFGAAGNAPAILAEGAGILVLERLPGSTVPASALDARRAAALGAIIRSVHDAEVAEGGRWPDWDHDERTIAGYHARVVALVRSLAPLLLPDLVAAVLDRLPPLPAAEAHAFRRLHGDLWSGNVVWAGDRPALVDWEYSRVGDPAEDLAYLIEMDDLPPPLAAALLEAYGRPELDARVRAWRPLAALGAGLWYAELGAIERAEQLLRQAAAR